MKQCDRNLSPLPIGSSSLSFAASESDPEDSFWREFSFDFSFLSSEDQKNSLDADDDATPSKAEESKGDFVRPVRVQRFDPEIKRIEKSDSFLQSDLKCVDDSKPSPSLDVVPTSHFDSSFDVVEGFSQHYPSTASVLGVTKIAAVPNDVSGNGGAKGRVLEELVVSKDINGINSTPHFSKMSPLRFNSTVLSEKSSIFSDQDDTEEDSPCWRGIRSHNSFDLRRSSDDLNVLSRLNPLAPQFVPSSAKKKLDKNGKVTEEYTSSSLKRSLSLTFPPSSGEVRITDPSGAWIEFGSGQDNIIDTLVQDADESLGLVSQESICKTLSILDISDEFQKSKKLDPLAPLFVPANAKLSTVIHEKHGVAAHSTSVASSSGDVAKVHESGKTYSFNPRLGVQITENTKLDGSSKKSYGPKKLNPLAPQFSLAKTKPKGYGSEKNQAVNDLPPKMKSSVLVSSIGYRNQKELHAGLVNSPAHVEPSSSNANALSDFGQNVGHCGSSSPSPKMDVTKLLTTIHGLSELLAHVGGPETSDSPNEQHLDLINSTVQNLNSYVNNRVQEHTGTYASPIHSSYDPKLMPNTRKRFRDREQPMAQNMTYSMVSGEMVLHDSQFEYGVTKENGYGKVIRNHAREEQINSQALFYRSLWLKAKADSSLMEYESFLAKNQNFSNL